MLRYYDECWENRDADPQLLGSCIERQVVARLEDLESHDQRLDLLTIVAGLHTHDKEQRTGSDSKHGWGVFALDIGANISCYKPYLVEGYTSDTHW